MKQMWDKFRIGVRCGFVAGCCIVLFAAGEKSAHAQTTGAAVPATPPGTAQAAAPPIQVPAAPSDGPSYADTLKWIQTNMNTAGVPVPSRTQTGTTFVCTQRKSDGTCADGYNDANGYSVTSSASSHYTIQADGCQNLTVINSQGYASTSNDAGTGAQSDSGVISTRWKLPFASIDEVMISPQKVKLPDLCDESHPVGSPAPPPCDPGYGWEIYIIMKDESGTYYGQTFGGDPMSTPITAQNSPVPNTTLPGVGILFGMPGGDDVAPRMVKALQHLVQVCKEHPDQVPKSLF